MSRRTVPALTDETMLKDIYGWAAFNTCGANRIIDTQIPGGAASVLDIKTLYQRKIE